jgi:acetylornithine deacetylase/succinyl-diaminopimelate desuccinylase-like protein
LKHLRSGRPVTVERVSPTRYNGPGRLQPAAHPTMNTTSLLLFTSVSICLGASLAGQPAAPDRAAIEDETLKHFQAILRVDSTTREEGVARYVADVLAREGIPAQLLTTEPGRPNVVARLKGSGRKRPILIVGHSDVVPVDQAKWTHPPFDATREGGYVYGRGTVDDKDNLVAALMAMLTLKRRGVALDRDVIFLSESGEEGATRVGIQFLVREHFPEIDAEYCLAEGGNVTRIGGAVRFASVQTLEKIPRAITLTARGTSGHGSVPLQDNAIVHLAAAVGRLGAWRAPIALNDTTRAYFTRLAGVSSPDDAARYRAIVGADAAARAAADDHLVAREPRHASMLRTSVSPNVIAGGYRVNVIPSEATASLDVRMLPADEPAAFLARVNAIIADPAVEAAYGQRDVRPGGTTRLDTEAFSTIETAIKEHYGTVTLPTMSTGATDMAYLRAKGMQCYGIGPAIDFEDGPRGFGAHSDQERILESELHRFVRFHYDIVERLAKKK